MSVTVPELYVAAEAAKTAYKRHGLTGEALQAWLAAEVAWQQAVGVDFIVAPTEPPMVPHLVYAFSTIASTLCDMRYRAESHSIQHSAARMLDAVRS